MQQFEQFGDLKWINASMGIHFRANEAGHTPNPFPINCSQRWLAKFRVSSLSEI